MIYIVDFNAHRPLFGASAQPFYDELIRQPTRSWAKCLNNTWLISTPEPIEDLHKRLLTHMVNDDRLLIVELTFQTRYTGWLPQEVWAWLTQQIQSGALYG